MKALVCDGCHKKESYDAAGVPKTWFRVKVDFYERSSDMGQMTVFDLCPDCGAKLKATSKQAWYDDFYKVLQLK